MAVKKLLVPVLLLIAGAVTAQQIDPVGAGPGPGTRYATDAWPGFDGDRDSVKPERKTPRWFSWITGPKRDTAADQMAYCAELEADENWSKAAKHYDALVRNWPTAPEALDAQKRLAEIYLDKLDDAEESFAAYRYLIDFYSFRCDYNATVDKMYEIAQRLRKEGKTIVYFRFKNTAEVRRAFESCILRAPGAKWAPAALLAVGELREEELEDEKAIAVYENLRNLHYETAEAKTGVAREAKVRLKLLREHGYNRARCQDTLAFFKMARAIVTSEEAIVEIDAAIAEAEALLEEEAYRAAIFYDSRQRTKRSAANAYEGFLREYPNGVHADDVKARLEKLKEAVQK